jgi:hypothetical protein
VCEPSQHAHVLQALLAVLSIFCFYPPWDKVQFFTHFTYKFSIAPFHQNPPTFNMLLVSNSQDKNKRKLNKLKHLIGDLVTFGTHVITKSLQDVWIQPCTCASGTFGSCFYFLFLPALGQSSNFHTFYIQIFHSALS